MFEDLVRPAVIDDGVGVEFELGFIEGVGDGPPLLFSGEDEIRAATFVLAPYFPDQKPAEGVSVGDPADVGQLFGALLVLVSDVLRCGFHDVFS